MGPHLRNRLEYYYSRVGNAPACLPPPPPPHLSAHVAAGHVGEDGLQHDLDRRGPLAQRGEDGEEAVAHRDGVQTPVEVLVLGEVQSAGPWR